MQELWQQFFSYKNLFQIASRIFATEYYFIDHVKHKTVNKIICGTP